MKGVVSKIYKNGKAYNIKVEDTWYGYGFEKPQFDEGTMVEFDVTNRGEYKNVTKDSLKVLGKEEVSSSTKVVSTRVQHTQGKDAYWEAKEARDIKNDVDRSVGASRNTAISFVELLIKNEALKIPTKVSDKADALLQAVEYYANWFMTHSPNSPTEKQPPVSKTSKSQKQEEEEEEHDEDVPPEDYDE